jgi:hypothetical protein
LKELLNRQLRFGLLLLFTGAETLNELIELRSETNRNCATDRNVLFMSEFSQTKPDLKKSYKEEVRY